MVKRGSHGSLTNPGEISRECGRPTAANRDAAGSSRPGRGRTGVQTTSGPRENGSPTPAGSAQGTPVLGNRTSTARSELDPRSLHARSQLNTHPGPEVTPALQNTRASGSSVTSDSAVKNRQTTKT